jgi:hypothetical protein
MTRGRRTPATAGTSQQASYQLFVSERYFRLPQQARGSPATGRTRQTTVENYKLSDLLHWIGRFLCRETLVNLQLAKHLRRYQLTGTSKAARAWAACKSGRCLVSRTRNFTRRMSSTSDLFLRIRQHNSSVHV